MKRRLTERQRKARTLLLKGNCSVTKALKQAGYTETPARFHQKKTLQRLGIVELCEREGLTDRKIIHTIKGGLDANKVISAVGGKDANGGTVDFVDVPDWGKRLKASELAAKLKRILSDGRQEIDVRGEINEQRKIIIEFVGAQGV